MSRTGARPFPTPQGSRKDNGTLMSLVGLQSAWDVISASLEAMSGSWCMYQHGTLPLGMHNVAEPFDLGVPPLDHPGIVAWSVRTAPPTDAAAQQGGAPSGIAGISSNSLDEALSQDNRSYQERTYPDRSHPDRQDLPAAGVPRRPVPMPQREAFQALFAARCSIGSMKGNKSTSPNQDRAMYSRLGLAGPEFMAVFDGHGEAGHVIADVCCEVLPKLLLRILSRPSPGAASSNSFPALPPGERSPGGKGPPVRRDRDMNDRDRGNLSYNQQERGLTTNPQEVPNPAEWWREGATHAFEEMHAELEALAAQAMAEEKEDTRPVPEQGDRRQASSKMSIDARTSGTTGTVLVLLPGPRLFVAHTGDSKAALGIRPRGRDGVPWRILELTRDHKPDLPDERQRIEAHGAQVVSVGTPPNSTNRVFTPNQTWPSINMSRSLGDLHAHSQGLSAECEALLLDRPWDPSTEEAVIIVASDGVWDVIDPTETVNIVASSAARSSDAASFLAREAYERWGRRGLQANYSDDITVIVKFL